MAEIDLTTATADGAQSTAPRSLAITADAARRIAALVRQEGRAEDGAGLMLRVFVSGGGCSGFQYGFSLDDARNEDDAVFERDGATVIVDSCSLDLLAGCEIDWVENLVGAAFQINNPNASSSCGCGSSFSI